MSKSARDFQATHAHEGGVLYEKLHDATQLGTEPDEYRCELVIYRSGEGKVFTATKVDFENYFSPLPIQYFDKVITPELMGALQEQLMTAGAILQSIRPESLPRLANTLEHEMAKPATMMQMGAIQRRQWEEMIIMMRLCEKLRNQWVFTDAAYKLYDPNA